MNLNVIWQYALGATTVDLRSSIHGPEHWAAVERNGLYLARELDINPVVVRLFAVFHDCKRLSDGVDDEHGARGALFAASLRPQVLGLDETEFEKLLYACRWHTILIHTPDPLIGACWDADRLDLGRVGIRPCPEYLNTVPARRLAGSRDFRPLGNEPLRAWRLLML